MTTLKPEPAQSGWDLWLQWIGLSMLGLGLGLLMGGPIIGFGAVLAGISGHLSGAVGGAVMGGVGGSLLGFVAGITQRSVLQRHVAGPWVLATMAGYALSLALLTSLFGLSSSGLPFCFDECSSGPPAIIDLGHIPGLQLWSLGGLALGTIVGTLQWLGLRRHVSRAGWWIVASVAGSMVAALIGYALNSQFPTFPKSIGDWSGGFFSVPIVFGPLGALAYAIITGAVLVRLLRGSTRMSEPARGRAVTAGVWLGIFLPMFVIAVALLAGGLANRDAASDGAQADFSLVDKYTAERHGGTTDAIAFDGTNIWVVHDGWIKVIRPNDGARVTTPIFEPYRSIHMAFDGTNMWVTTSMFDNVLVLRPSDGSLLRRVPVGGGPLLDVDAITFDGTNMWVVNTYNDSVSVLRASDGFTVMTRTLSPRDEHSFIGAPALAYDGTNMWVSGGHSNTLNVLRARDGYHVMTVRLASTPVSLVFDGVHMWVTDGKAVRMLNISDGALVAEIPVAAPSAMAFDGANMWVTSYAGSSISVLQASDGALAKTVHTRARPGAIGFDGKNMWVMNDDHTISKR